jgi:hypothetical protein
MFYLFRQKRTFFTLESFVARSTGTFEAAHSVLARPAMSTFDVVTQLYVYNRKTVFLKIHLIYSRIPN